MDKIDKQKKAKTPWYRPRLSIIYDRDFGGSGKMNIAAVVEVGMNYHLGTSPISVHASGGRMDSQVMVLMGMSSDMFMNVGPS